ncbi:MAG: pilus assembly protein TadG-related protein [Bryobacteraceae bacterium]
MSRRGAGLRPAQQKSAGFGGPGGVARPITHHTERGAMSLQLIVLMAPVLFGLMGFGLDLGRLLLVRGELNAAAEAAALAAAAKLIGNEAALEQANAALRLTLDDGGGRGNRYNFGSLVIGESTGFLNSQVPDPEYFTAAVDAIGEDSAASGVSGASGSTARYVRVNLNAEAPLLFWGLLALGQERKTLVSARAVAGISPPLCTACTIEPFAIAALSVDDPVDFGFVPGTRYTLGFQCNGNPTNNQGPLPATTQRLPYLIIDRLNAGSILEESQQLYRAGAQGLPGSTVSAQSCISVNAEEIGWASATPNACQLNQVAASVRAAVCGLASRFDVVPPGACTVVTDVDTLAASYIPDSDISELDDYTQYTGNARRVITIAVVDTLNVAGPMLVQGFRQFLVEPNQNDVNINPGDGNARFGALYIGSVEPVRQGRFHGCSITAGPGKVVLHR